MKTVHIPQIGDVQLHKRRGSSSVKISITSSGSIRVTQPYWLPYTAGVSFARNQKTWIIKNRTTVMPLTNGLLVGKTHRLLLIPEIGRTKTSTRVTSSREVRVAYPAELAAEDPQVQGPALNACIRALKLQADTILKTRLRELAQEHGFEYRSATTKRLKSRWGSCSSMTDITLNIFLVQLPWHLIDYVLLHELTHTRIMAHGAVFWSEVAKYVPNLKSVRAEMKTYRPVMLTES